MQFACGVNLGCKMISCPPNSCFAFYILPRASRLHNSKVIARAFFEAIIFPRLNLKILRVAGN